MAKINFYRIEIEDIEKNVIIDKNIGNFLQEYIDRMNDSERFCRGGKCYAILSDYLSNNENKDTLIPFNITFDFSKFTEKKVNSAIIANPLTDTDTFHELNQKTIQTANYSKNDLEIISTIINETNEYKELIENLRNTSIDPYVIYKILTSESFKVFNENENIDFHEYYYDNVLNRLQKDKTYFNFIKIKDKNVLSVLFNPDGFDFKKIIEYLNSHILIHSKIKLKYYNIYEDSFSDILNYSEMKSFEFTYQSNENSLLDKDDFNSKFEAFSNLLGNKADHEIKISVNADEDHTLSNERICNLFNLLKEAGLMKSCKVRKKGNRNFVDSSSIGDLLKYTSSIKFDSLPSANYIFLDAYNKTFNSILDRLN